MKDMGTMQEDHISCRTYDKHSQNSPKIALNNITVRLDDILTDQAINLRKILNAGSSWPLKPIITSFIWQLMTRALQDQG